MKHEQVQALLSDYLEDNLPEEAVRDLESHLEGCEKCRSALELLRRALRVIHKVPRVEAPPEFSLRLKRRIRKAGLFKLRDYKPATRVLVPFEAIMAVLLAAMGALVIFLLVFYNQFQSLVVEQPTVAVLVKSNEEINLIARTTWEVGGKVHALGREVPEGSPLGASPELELTIPPEGWPAFVDRLGQEARKAGLPRSPAPVHQDGLVHVIVQIRLRTKAGGGSTTPRGAGDPASSPAPPRIPPGPKSPPPGDKEQ